MYLIIYGHISIYIVPIIVLISRRVKFDKIPTVFDRRND